MYQRSDQFISSDLGNSQVLSAINQDKFYGINTVGSRIWEYLKEPVTIDQIVESLLSTFEIEKEQCQTEVGAFLEELLKARAIKKV